MIKSRSKPSPCRFLSACVGTLARFLTPIQNPPETPICDSTNTRDRSLSNVQSNRSRIENLSALTDLTSAVILPGLPPVLDHNPHPVLDLLDSSWRRVPPWWGLDVAICIILGLHAHRYVDGNAHGERHERLPFDVHLSVACLAAAATRATGLGGSPTAHRGLDIHGDDLNFWWFGQSRRW